MFIAITGPMTHSNQPVKFITIVSGLPRSGTSVMMQMLAAGGMRVLTDGLRAPDIDNPRGYFELEAVKSTASDCSWLSDAPGKAVKIVHALLPQLPLNREYRVIFMRRDLDEVLASQRKMLDRQGRKGASLTDTQLKSIYASQLQNTLRWVREIAQCRILEVSYGTLVAEPTATANLVNTFLDHMLDEAAMVSAIDPSLHRNRSPNSNPHS